MEFQLDGRGGNGKMRGLVIDTAHDDAALVDLIDTPRRARRRSDAARIRRMLYRSSPAGTPNTETALGVRGDFKHHNNRPPLWQQVGDGKPCNILNDGPEVARQSSSLQVDYVVSPVATFSATPPNASHDPPMEQSSSVPSISATGVTRTDATRVQLARDDSDDDQTHLLGKENSTPKESDTPRTVHQLYPLLSSVSPNVQANATSNTDLESNLSAKEQSSFLSDDMPTTSISPQVSDISEQETPSVLVEEASQPTASTMQEDTGGVTDTIDMQHGLYLPSSLTGTCTSMTGSSVDVDALVEDFIGGKNVDDDPDVNMEDFDSYGSSRDSILMSSSIKDAKILPTFERSLNSDVDFDLNLHQIHLNNSSLSFSSRGDMTSADRSNNESSVDIFAVSNGNKPITTIKEALIVPNPSRPTNPLKKKPVESRKTTVMPAVRARRFRLRPDVRNDVATRDSPPPAKAAEENRSDVSDIGNILSRRDLPPLPSMANPQPGVKLTDLGSYISQATGHPSPMQEIKDTQNPVSPCSETQQPVQKVYSYYTPVAPLDFVENRPADLNDEGFATVQTTLDSSSDSNAKMPSPIHSSESPIADDIDQILSVLRSSSYSNAETASSNAIGTNDDVRVPDIPPTATDQTVGRNNGHPDMEHADVIETEPPSPVKRKVELPDEDIDVADSSSCDDDLEFDSIRLFERQVEAQMQQREADISKSSQDYNNDSDDVESNTNTTLIVAMREEDLVCPPPNDVGISQSAGQITELETRMVPSNSSRELVPSQEQLTLRQEVTEVEPRMAPPNSERELVPNQEELKLLRDAVIQLDAALERQRVVLKIQRREIASLKKERDLLRADLKASRALPRSKWQDDPLMSQCVGKMGSWSNQFSSTLKCE